MTSHILENMSETITNDYSQTHEAIDVVAAGNNIDNVIAVSDGTVEMVVKDAQYTDHNTKGTATYGNFVKLRHPDGKKSLYAHLKYGSVTVSSGDEVTKGEKLGTIGATGNAYGAHLHFEIRNPDETRDNPNNFLNQNITSNEEENKEIITEIKENEKELTEIKENEEETKENNEVNEIAPSNTLINNNYYGGSIVDGLKGIGIDSSFDNRTLIALKNGIQNYRGTYNQNVYLLKLLKEGNLKA